MLTINAYDDFSMNDYYMDPVDFACNQGSNPLTHSGNIFFVDDDCFVDQPEATLGFTFPEPIKQEAKEICPTFNLAETPLFGQFPWNDSGSYFGPIEKLAPIAPQPQFVQTIPPVQFVSPQPVSPPRLFSFPMTPSISMTIFPQEPMSFYRQETKSCLNTFHFDSQFPSSCSFASKAPQKLPFDISRALPNAKYSEVFQQHAEQLLLEKHPQFTEQDLKHIIKTGYVYFLKNVKTIVPKIGQEWRFISHVRSSGESSERSYNLLGNLPLRCKVKEWMVDGNLWRMYHFVQGKPAKQNMAR